MLDQRSSAAPLPSRVAALFIPREDVSVFAADLTTAQQDRARAVALASANRSLVIVLRSDIAA